MINPPVVTSLRLECKLSGQLAENTHDEDQSLAYLHEAGGQVPVCLRIRSGKFLGNTDCTHNRLGGGKSTVVP